MVKSTAILAAASLACIAGAASARDVFADPPAECRPETWFHFIGGNVAKEGITADLEAIAGAGISGVQLFHGQFGGPWPGVSPQITCLSAPWDGMVAFTAAECRRLGLRFTMQNCPGWATSGGPWIKPADAMRQLEWMRVDVKGGRKVEVKLPRRKWGAQERDRDYRDVAVLAFPAPAGDWDRPLAPDAVESSVKTGLEKWKSGRAQASLPGGREAVFEFVFARPVAVRTLELPSVNSMGHGWCYDPQTDIRFEAGGKVLVDAAVPSANWQDDRPVTYACDETVATRFKLTVKPRHGIKFGLPRLFESARNDDWEAQAGWTMRRLMRNPPRRQSPAAWVRSREVRNLTGLMDKDGTLRWDAPEGEWGSARGPREHDAAERAGPEGRHRVRVRQDVGPGGGHPVRQLHRAAVRGGRPAAGPDRRNADRQLGVQAADVDRRVRKHVQGGVRVRHLAMDAGAVRLRGGRPRGVGAVP